MAAKGRQEFPVSLVLRATDQASAQIKQVARRLDAMTAPVRRLGKNLGALSDAAGVGRLVRGFGGVRNAVGQVSGQAMALTGRLAGLGIAAGVAFGAFASRAIKVGDDLATVSARLGFTVDEFASLEYAAEQGEVSTQKFRDSMEMLSRTIGQLKSGTGPLRGFLEKVSPAFAQQLKGVKGNAQALDLLAQAFEKVKDPTKQAALANAAFGGSGKDMISFLALGRKQIAAYREQQMRLQGSQEAFAKGAADLDLVLRETRYAFAGVSNALAASFFPAMGELAKIVTAFLAEHREGLAAWARETAAAISAWVAGGGVKRLAETLQRFGRRAAEVFEKIGGWKTALAGIGALMAGPLLAAIAGLVSAVGALIGAIGLTPVGWVLIGLAAIAAAVALVSRNFDRLKEIFGPVIRPLGEQLKNLGAEFAKLWEVVGPVLLPVLKQIGFVLGVVVVGAIVAIVGILRVAIWMIDTFISSVNDAIDSVKALFTEGPGAFFAREMDRPAGAALSRLFSGDRPELPVPIAEAAGAAAAQQSEAHVTVDFSNVPPGVSIEPDRRGTADLDLNMSMGYASALP